jgi:hypothetical protein
VKIAVLAATVVVVTACGPGAPEQEAAAREVARAADADRVECTGRSRFWFAEGPPAEDFICAAHVSAGVCDRYRVDREGSRFRVRLLERQASCVLPVG